MLGHGQAHDAETEKPMRGLSEVADPNLVFDVLPWAIRAGGKTTRFAARNVSVREEIGGSRFLPT